MSTAFRKLIGEFNEGTSIKASSSDGDYRSPDGAAVHAAGIDGDISEADAQAASVIQQHFELDDAAPTNC